MTTGHRNHIQFNYAYIFDQFISLNCYCILVYTMLIIKRICKKDKMRSKRHQNRQSGLTKSLLYHQCIEHRTNRRRRRPSDPNSSELHKDRPPLSPGIPAKQTLVCPIFPNYLNQITRKQMQR